MSTGWVAKAIADHLSELLGEEVGAVYEEPNGKRTVELVSVEDARVVDRRKSTFFAATAEGGRQYRVTVSEWRERAQ